VILLKNDKVIDFFNMTAYRFFSIKMFKLKCYLIYKKKLITRYCR